MQSDVSIIDKTGDHLYRALSADTNISFRIEGGKRLGAEFSLLAVMR